MSLNLNDPGDSESEGCAVCGLPIDGARDKSHQGIHEECQIADYRTPAQQTYDSLVNGQRDQCLEFMEEIGLHQFSYSCLWLGELSESEYLTCVRTFTRK